MAFSIKGRNPKDFYEYVILDENTNTSIQKYIESPALTFLRYCKVAKNAITNCKRSFSNSKEGLAHIRHISVAMLPAIMGHFETYQRFLFAGVFDLSSSIINFDTNAFFGDGKDKGLGLRSGGDNIQININGLLGYRGTAHINVGVLLADNLHDWHNPEKVNKYFKAFDFKTDMYTKKDRINLEVLWQLRHSIVHTGGTITLPDAQKIKLLSSFGGQTITFQNQFIVSLCRKFSETVKSSTKRIEKAFKDKLDTSKLTIEDQKRIEKLFLIESS